MSTGWITDPVIPFDDLMAAELEGAWVAEDAGGSDKIALTDGRHYVWAHRHPEMGHAYFEVNVESKNEPGASAIRDAVAAGFGVEWYSERDPEFWDEPGPDEGEGPGSVTVHADRGLPMGRRGMSPSQVSLRLRMIASAVDRAGSPDPRRVAGLLARVADEIPPTQRSPRSEDWEDVEFEEDAAPPTTRSPDLKVRSKQFVSDMEAGVNALKGIVQSGPEGRESDMRGELELVTRGAEGLSGLL